MPQQFLIIKMSSLGDIIHAYPVIDYLKAKFPNCQIDWVVERSFADLVRAHPLVSTAFCADTRLWRKAPFSRTTRHEMFALRKSLQETRYDCVFDLQGNMKSALFTLQAKSPHKVGFSWSSVFEWPNLLVTNRRYNPPKGHNVRDEYLSLVQNYFQDTQPYQAGSVILKISEEDKTRIHSIVNSSGKEKCTVLVCAGSAWRNKQMTEEAFADFLQRVQTHLSCDFLLTWGSPEEREAAQRLQQKLHQHAQLIDKLPLPLLQNLMAHVDLIIAMDSLPLHLAGTTSTPTFSIFGASCAEKFKPMGTQHHAYQGSCPYGRSFERRCPVLRTCKTGLCIRGLSGETVFEAFMKGKMVGIKKEK